MLGRSLSQGLAVEPALISRSVRHFVSLQPADGKWLTRREDRNDH